MELGAAAVGHYTRTLTTLSALRTVPETLLVIAHTQRCSWRSSLTALLRFRHTRCACCFARSELAGGVAGSGRCVRPDTPAKSAMRRGRSFIGTGPSSLFRFLTLAVLET
jgi:hypothetical protein